MRKISYGEGVERVFPLYSPLIAEIAVVRRGDVRRAKLYYLRGRSRQVGAHRRDGAQHRRPRPATRQAARAKPKPPTDARREDAMSDAKPRTLFDKIWDSHVVERLPDGTCILYIDRHLLHEVTSPQAFEGLRMAGRKLRRPDLTIAVADHNIPTVGSRMPRDIKEEDSRIQVETLEKNVVEFGVPYIPILDVRQGIVHIIGPELGISPAGHDDRVRRLAYLDAWRDGRAGVRHRHVRGRARDGDADAAAAAGEEHGDRASTARWASAARRKDIVLAIIGKIGTAGGTGHVIEYTGEAIRALDMAGRMTVSQHVDRGRRAGRADRAGRDDVRLRQGPRIRAEGRGVGAGGGVLAHAADRSRRALRHDAWRCTPPISRRW